MQVAEQAPRTPSPQTRRVVGAGAISPLLASPETLEPLSRLRIEAIPQAGAAPSLLVLAVLLGLEIAQERPRRELAYLLARDAPDDGIRGDEADELRAAVLGGQALEHVVRVVGVADGQRTDVALLPSSVEHDHSPRALRGDVARERVHELPLVGERARMEEVVAVEQVERRI